jgi:hypothetical protein
MIHKVRSPFMSRVGQFEEGKHTLVVGIDAKTLFDEQKHYFTMGKNPQRYSITIDDAITYGELWENKDDREVYIVPVNKCKIECSHITKQFIRTSNSTGYIECVDCKECL